MPSSMIRCAARAAYGEKAFDAIKGLKLENMEEKVKRETSSGIRRRKEKAQEQAEAMKFQLGDSVMVYPDKKIGIVCQTANEKGVLRVQLPGKKIWVNHRRIKLQVAATELYPEDYDFSILFDTVENRKLRHQMERKYVQGKEVVIEK